MSNTPKSLKSFGGTQGGSSGTCEVKSLKNKRRLGGGSTPPIKGLSAWAEKPAWGHGREPEIGVVVSLDDQVYELVGSRGHTRVDGSATTILEWSTNCAACGTTFIATSGIKPNALNRRCTNCRRQGKPVKGKRGRKVSVTVISP